jgi:hypothetical protein
MIHRSKRIQFYEDRYQNNGKRKAKVHNFMNEKVFCVEEKYHLG